MEDITNFWSQHTHSFYHFIKYFKKYFYYRGFSTKIKLKKINNIIVKCILNEFLIIYDES
jgi:hypothetical protein